MLLSLKEKRKESQSMKLKSLRKSGCENINRSVGLARNDDHSLDRITYCNIKWNKYVWLSTDC